MIAITKTIGLNGLEGYIIEVQVDVSNGLPCLEIVGLPDIRIKEAKQRVKAAIIRKEGSVFDLSIAIAMLIAMGEIKPQSIQNIAFIGELSLDGGLQKTNGILPICIEAKKLGIKKIFLSKQNVKEACIVAGLEIIAINSLKEAIYQLNSSPKVLQKSEKSIKEEPAKEKEYNLDYSEVKGQENAKRAIETYL